MYSGKEKRKNKRIKQQFMVRLREKPSGIDEQVSGDWDMVTTRNLSAGGVLLNCSNNLSLGSLLEMRINFPLVDDPIHCVGEVTRAENIPQSPLVRMAAVFTQMDQGVSGLIERAAEEFYFKKPQRIEA